MTKKEQAQLYNQRLSLFMTQLQSVKQKPQALQAIMDTVPFRDLETALMMATLEGAGDAR